MSVATASGHMSLEHIFTTELSRSDLQQERLCRDLAKYDGMRMAINKHERMHKKQAELGLAQDKEDLLFLMDVVNNNLNIKSGRYRVGQIKSVKEYKKFWGMEKPWRFLDVLELELGKRLKHQAFCKQRKNWLHRILVEFVESVEVDGWYPIFNTLTCNDTVLSKIYRDGTSTLVRDHHRDIWRTMKKELKADGVPVKDSDRTQYFRYISIPEFGTSEDGTNRLHFHNLLFLKFLPKGWEVDPNAKFEGYRREIDALKAYWKGGFSSPIAIRLDTADIWGSNLGWRWPLDKRTMKPLRTGSAIMIAHYVSKYMTKEHRSWEKENKVRQRIACSPQFGMGMIDRLLRLHEYCPKMALTGELIRKLMLCNEKKGMPLPTGSLIKYRSVKLLRHTKLTAENMVEFWGNNSKITRTPFRTVHSTAVTELWESTKANNTVLNYLKTLDSKPMEQLIEEATHRWNEVALIKREIDDLWLATDDLAINISYIIDGYMQDTTIGDFLGGKVECTQNLAEPVN